MLNPETYARVNEERGKYIEVEKFLTEHGKQLEWRPEEVVLDIGCGPGDITKHALLKWLPGDVSSLLGVDISAEMINYAQATFSNEKLEFANLNIEGDVSEILRCQKYSRGFDKAFSFYVLNWLQNLERGLSNLYTLMKPGGQALVTFPIDKYFEKSCKDVKTKKQWAKYFEGVDRDLTPFPSTSDPAKELTTILEAVGFEVDVCKVNDITLHFDTMENIKGMFESLDQDNRRVPAQLKDQYLNDCVQELEAMGVLNKQNNSVLELMLTCMFRKPKYKNNKD